MKKTTIAIVVALVLGAAAAGGWWLQRSPPEQTARDFFEHDFADYWIAATRGEAREDLVAAAPLSPALKEKVSALGAAFPDVARAQAAGDELNAALAAEGHRVIVDVHGYDGRPVIITYELERRAEWRHGERTIVTRRVHRLDHTNVVPTWLGHAGQDEPLVLLDRIEVAILDLLRDVASPRGNVVDRAALETTKAIVERRLGEGRLSQVAERLKLRDELHEKLETTLVSRRVRVPYPERFLLGEAYFERLDPYADPTRRGGPLFVRPDLKALRTADRSLAEQESLEVLEALRDLEAAATEAHEAHHIAHGELDPSLVPGELMEVIGDDLTFATEADGELRAYLGELHASKAPPCVALGRIARIAAGARARGVAHHYAGQVLFHALTEQWPRSTDDFATTLRAMCALDDGELRKRAAKAYEYIYKEPIPALQ